MAIIKTTIRGALGGALMMVALACGASQQRAADQAADQSAAATESVPDTPVGAAPRCVGDKEQPVACLSDGDCCSGFVCGKDPELSARTSYCIYGG